MNPEQVLTLYVDHLARASDRLPREVVQIAMLFDGHRRIHEVIQESCLSDRMTVVVVNRLRDLGIVGKNGTERPFAAARNAAATAAGIDLAQFPCAQPSCPDTPVMNGLPPAASLRDSAPQTAPTEAVGAAADPSLAETVQISREALAAALPEIAAGPDGGMGVGRQVETLQRALDLALDLSVDQAAPLERALPTVPQPIETPAAASHVEVEIEVAESDLAAIQAAEIAAQPCSAVEVDEVRTYLAEIPVDAVAPTGPSVIEVPGPESAITAEKAATFNEFERDFFESYVPEDGTVDTFWDLEETPWRRERAKRRAQRRPRRSFFSMLLNL